MFRRLFSRKPVLRSQYDLFGYQQAILDFFYHSLQVDLSYTSTVGSPTKPGEFQYNFVTGVFDIIFFSDTDQKDVESFIQLITVEEKDELFRPTIH